MSRPNSWSRAAQTRSRAWNLPFTPPVRLHLRQQLERRRFDAARLGPVHVETQLQPVDRLVPGVVALDSPEHVVQQALAQRAVADLQLPDPQPGHGFPQNRQPAGEHRRPPRVEVLQTQTPDPAGADHLADDGVHRLHGQAALDQAHASRHALAARIVPDDPTADFQPMD